MFDVTGQGWASHMLQGTSQLLCLREPNQYLCGNNRNFYLTVRIYEIVRALAYYDTTFLSQTAWTELEKHLWVVKGENNDWHPIENLFELIISTSALLCRYGPCDIQKFCSVVS
jgi:hypothetical protein